MVEQAQKKKGCLYLALLYFVVSVFVDFKQIYTYLGSPTVEVAGETTIANTTTSTYVTITKESSHRNEKPRPQENKDVVFDNESPSSSPSTSPTETRMSSPPSSPPPSSPPTSSTTNATATVVNETTSKINTVVSANTATNANTSAATLILRKESSNKKKHRTRPHELAQERVKTYIAWHSSSKLHGELKRCGNNATNCSVLQQRRFIVGEYSCPHQLGNRVHVLLNALIFGIVTNRTLLWKYCDLEDICPHHGDKSGCDKWLELNSWVPGYEEWSYLLGKEQKKLVESHINARLNKLGKFDTVGGTMLNVGKMEQQQVGDILSRNRNLYKYLENPKLQAIAQDLFAAGKFYTYGMAFNALFTFSLATLPQSLRDQNNSDIPQTLTTIALHSRHQWNVLKGDKVEKELKCLNQTFHKLAPKTKEEKGFPCAVHLMSDRNLTLNVLKPVVRNVFNCTAVVAAHHEGEGLNQEHGPFAGPGFLQDLALAFFHVTDGVIIHKGSTASMLLAELVTYRAVTNNLPPPSTCYYNIIKS
uniref:Uncharacterized protein n=1 Tax=Aplanochytrium stocchinoi TaxID=215587 RepID=A0A7S3PKA2_9STRA